MQTYREALADARPIGEAVSGTIRRIQNGTHGKETFMQRLQARWGLGDNPKKRMVLYAKINTAYIQNQDLLLALLAEAEMGAALADNPPHYFCKAMAGKLREHAEALKIVPRRQA